MSEDYQAWLARRPSLRFAQVNEAFGTHIVQVPPLCTPDGMLAAARELEALAAWFAERPKLNV